MWFYNDGKEEYDKHAVFYFAVCFLSLKVASSWQVIKKLSSTYSDNRPIH